MRLGGLSAARGAGRPQRGDQHRVLAEHRLVQRAEFGAEVDAEFLGQTGPQVLVRGESLALAPRQVESPHLHGA